MVPIIDPEDDYLTIAAAEEQMALTHDVRQKELHEAHAKLKRESSSRPSTVPDIIHLLVMRVNSIPVYIHTDTETPITTLLILQNLPRCS